jgi:hypothetical protein
VSALDLTAAIQAAYVAVEAAYADGAVRERWDDADPYLFVMRAAIDAVAPLIEAAVREQIAAEIEAQRATDMAVPLLTAYGRGVDVGLNLAARIARGEPR